MKVVPEPSERCTTAIACFGSLTLGLSFAIAGSFQLLILPRKILASVGPSSMSSPGLMPSRLTTGTTPPMTVGNCTRPSFVEVLALQRRVGGAEVDGLGLDLLDAAARADRLVVQADAGLLLVGVRPLGVDRVGEGRAGAGNVGGARGRDKGGRKACRREGVDEFHGSLHAWAARNTTGSLPGYPLTALAFVSTLLARGGLGDCFWVLSAGLGWTDRRLMSSLYEASTTPV